MQVGRIIVRSGHFLNLDFVYYELDTRQGIRSRRVRVALSLDALEVCNVAPTLRRAYLNSIDTPRC